MTADLMVVVTLGIPVALIGWSLWVARARDRLRWDAHVDQAVRLTRDAHPSRPRGPEDDPTWTVNR